MPRGVNLWAALVVPVLLASGCGGVDGGGGGSTPQVLTAAEVRTIIGQGVAEATAQGVVLTLAVVDHVGNVLAVYEMPSAFEEVTITSLRSPPVATGLDGVHLPAPLGVAYAAISKAGTSAYLSTQGNAFTTRTANQIVQEHFNPGELGRPGGPLFGIQFSQLPCGDLVTRQGIDALRGPKRMPLGLATNPGGVPLYISGVPVGGVGVELGNRVGFPGPDREQMYGLDPDVSDIDIHLEERIAVAAARGFSAPVERRADRTSVDGKFLRFTDDRATVTTAAASVAASNLIAVPGFYTGGAFLDGVEFLRPASGIRETTFEGLEAEILVDSANVNRFPPTSAATVPGLTLDEVRVILREALEVANRALSQTRPLSTSARVTISVVGLNGEILGIVRSRDAAIFSIDVSLQKARTAAFFSQTTAGADLSAVPFSGLLHQSKPLAQYVTDVRVFLEDFTALANGIAFSDRAVGNLSRPFFPDGIDGNVNGPLAQPFEDWSPFSTGLQLDLVINNLIASILPDATAVITDCTGAPLTKLPNGSQIFPGGVPIYKGTDLVGGIGVSGDGVDQDDMISFLAGCGESDWVGRDASDGRRAEQGEGSPFPVRTGSVSHG